MQRFQFFFVGRFVGHQIIAIAVVEQRPEFLDEAVHAVYAVRVPRFGLFHRTEEHLVHAERVCAVFLYNHVRIDNVEHGLAHFFNSPAADVFAFA